MLGTNVKSSAREIAFFHSVRWDATDHVVTVTLCNCEIGQLQKQREVLNSKVFILFLLHYGLVKEKYNSENKLIIS